MFIANQPPTRVLAGHKYSYSFTASGAPAPLFSLAGGTLPSGLALDATTGVLSGTPRAGIFTFRIAAANGVGTEAVSPVYHLTVDQAPTVRADRPGRGIVGARYSYRFAARGFPKPHFAVIKGAIPAGLQLNTATGLLSGTPKRAGAFHFTIQIDNGSKPSKTKRVTLVIDPRR
jgi:hypothetical protein